jgi:hypothetical protein
VKVLATGITACTSVSVVLLLLRPTNRPELDSENDPLLFPRIRVEPLVPLVPAVPCVP